MIQQVLVALMFATALFYLGRLIVKSFRAKSACATGCKCGVDFSKVEEKLKGEGFKVYEVDTSEFMKSGGSVFCMKMMHY